MKWSKFLGGLAVEPLASEKETPPPTQPLCKFHWTSQETVWGKTFYQLYCNYDRVGSLSSLPEGKVGWRWAPSDSTCSPGASPDDVQPDYCGMSLDEAKEKVEEQWRRYAKMFCGKSIVRSSPVAEEEREAISLPPIKYVWTQHIRPLDPSYVYYRLLYGDKVLGMLTPLPDNRHGWRWTLSLDATPSTVCDIDDISDFICQDYPGMMLDGAKEKVMKQLSKYESMFRIATCVK